MGEVENLKTRLRLAQEANGSYRDIIDHHREIFEQIGRLVPVEDDWEGGPGRLEDLAEILDRHGIERPTHSDYLKH